MELAVLAGAGLIGYLMNDEEPQKHNNIRNNNNNKHKNLARSTGDVLQQIDLIDAQEQFYSEPFQNLGYEKQFKPAMYEGPDEPTIMDDIDPLSNKNGWTASNDSTTYGVVPESQLSHNNMTHQYKVTHGYGPNEWHNTTMMDTKMDLFTGSQTISWKKKNENTALFEPSKDVSFTNGMPIYPDEMIDRFEPSRYHQHARPMEPIKVTPGLNLDYNEVGTDGFQPFYRPTQKTVDEMRVASKPKISYEGRTIDGQKGITGPIQAPVNKYRPYSFKITSLKDLLPTSDVNSGPKIQDNVTAKDTSRSFQHDEYMGIAFGKSLAVQKNVPSELREINKDSTRQTYTLPEPEQKFSKSEAVYNQNIKSFNLMPTLRNLTETNYRPSNIEVANGSSTYAENKDIARATTKETTNEIPRNTFTDLNQYAGQTHLQDIARATTKETTNEIPRNTFTDLNQYAGQTHLQDIARATTKETTNEIHRNTFTDLNQYAGQTHLQDIARATTKETTNGIYRNTFADLNQYAGQTHLQDIARTTIKETTNEIPRNNFLNLNKNAGMTHLQDNLKTTIKETTSFLPRNTFLSLNKNAGLTHLQELAKATIKQTTIDNKHIGILRHADQGYGYISSNFEAPNTHRQDTCLKTYIAPLKGDIKPRVYEDINNAHFNSVREKQQIYHAPTTSNVSIGVGAEDITMRQRDDNNVITNNNVSFTVNNQDRMEPQYKSKGQNCNYSNRFIDQTILEQLDKNPYHISIN